MSTKRSRLLYFICTLTVMFLGLASRRLSSYLPGWVNSYLGDFLWALMVFLTFSLIFNKRSTKQVTLMALAFSVSIEISQLYHSQWIEEICYMSGIVTGYFLEIGYQEALKLKSTTREQGGIMKVLILNGLENSETSRKIINILINEFNKKKYSTQSYNLCDIEIAGCLGCFGCWLRTPGICVINDSARDIARELIQSELAIFLTPITFGGYSYHLKKVLDRMIPLISPLFQRINGEVHHKKRYDRYPSTIGIGFLPDQDKESESIFHTLVKGNAVNFHSPYCASAVFFESQAMSDFQNTVQNLLIKVGV